MSMLVFLPVAVVVLVAAISIVTGTELVRGVLWLAVALLGTAVLYVLLDADFIAAVQVLLYTGGIITLMLFGLMLTARITSTKVTITSHGKLKGAVSAVALFAVLAWAILSSPLPEAAPGATAALDAKAIGAGFLTTWLLPMEVLSVLLLAVMIGAIVLARKGDPS